MTGEVISAEVSRISHSRPTGHSYVKKPYLATLLETTGTGKAPDAGAIDTKQVKINEWPKRS